MRVWVVEDEDAAAPAALATLLNHLAERAPAELRPLGSGPLTPAVADYLRGQTPDVLVIAEAAWPAAAWAEDVLAAGPGAVVIASPEAAARFRPLAERFPVVFLAPRPTPDGLWLALLGARCARQRQLACQEQRERLEQRLADRILIERAKGVLAQRLHLTEDEAYNRLRVLSRRQRRPMRDVARSFLDTQDLLVPGEPGPASAGTADEPHAAGHAPVPR